MPCSQPLLHQRIPDARLPHGSQVAPLVAAAMLAGVLAENFGVRPVLLGIAALLVITALGVLRVKSLHDIDSPSGVTGTPDN